MSLDAWIDVFVGGIAILVLIAAGLVEASLVRRQRLTIRELLESGDSARNADNSVEQSTRVRAAVDVAALLAVLMIGAAAVRFGMREFGPAGTIGILLVVAFGVLLAGRVIPSVIVDRYGLTESPAIQRLAALLSALVTPFTLVGEIASSALSRVAHDAEATPETGINGNAHYGAPNGNAESEHDRIQDDEHEMISGILSMEDATAREIMVPRPDVVAVPAKSTIADVVQVAQEAGHSRIPVYGESIDRIQGIIYAKDLLRFVTDDDLTARLADLMRPAVFVPESKRVDELLRDLRRSRVHMAIVVDEYGGTAGIVTIEDILEEIVGEIQDEYDRELPLYEFDANGEIRVDGRIGVDELSDLIGVPMPETESETVGGFVQRELGHIPEAGETVQAGRVAIRVESVERRRVRTLRVSTLDEEVMFDPSDTVRAI